MQKITKLEEYGAPKYWIEKLKMILAKFIETYKGKIDLDFWNSGLHFDIKLKRVPSFIN